MHDPSSGSSGLDVLLQDLRPARASYGRLLLHAPWGIDLPFQRGVRFHCLIDGECRLDVGGESVVLSPGDIALVPHGGAHSVRDRPRSPALPLDALPREQVGPSVYRLQAGSGGPQSLLICCTIDFDAPAAARVLAAMPPLLVVPRDETAGSGIEGVLTLMAEETRRERMGMATLLPRLADIVVTWSVRAWAERSTDRTGWLAALRHPGLARALHAVHREPGHGWTIEELARIAGMSRSAFMAAFRATLGQPPGRYLAEWRMALARDRLALPGTTIADTAATLGYGSEAAFSRAFKRITGASPGRVGKPAARS